jgi:hypothetical protein
MNWSWTFIDLFCILQTSTHRSVYCKSFGIGSQLWKLPITVRGNYYSDIFLENLLYYIWILKYFLFQTVVLLHTGLACLDDKNFKDATSYKPERWLDDLTKKSPFLVAPFGCGKRMCPGKRFIELELQIVLAKVSKEHLHQVKNNN